MSRRESAAFHTAQSVGNDGEGRHMIFTENCSSQDGTASKKTILFCILTPLNYPV